MKNTRRRPLTQLILNLIREEGRPLQLGEIVDLLQDSGKYTATVTTQSVSVLLNKEVKTHGILKIKKPFTYSFFMLSEWEHNEDFTEVNNSTFNEAEKVYIRKKETEWEYWREAYSKQEDRQKLAGTELLPSEKNVFDFLETNIKL